MEPTSYRRKSSHLKRVKQPKAYIIGGHGSEEGNETFIVPPGCIIVVKTTTGCTTKAYSFLEKGLCSLTPTILKDPISHYNELEHVLGSLAIYRPGDVCPQFHYSLLQCYQMSNVYWSDCNLFGSGVMDIDKMYADKELIQCTRNMESYNRELKSKHEFSKVAKYGEFDHESVYDSIYPYFPKLYQHSVFPSPQDVEIILHNAIDDGVNKLYNILEYIRDDVSITQEELCGLFPGVYYHVICRATPTGMSLFQSSVNEEYKIPSHVTYQSSKPHIRNLLKNISVKQKHIANHIFEVCMRKDILHPSM